MRIHDSETNKCKKKLMLEPKEFEQGIEYALANDCDGLQIDTWNIDDDAVMDFKLLRKSLIKLYSYLLGILILRM